MYDFDVSPGTISAVTDKLLPLITEWRSRPLEAVYPILFMDGMYFKSRENGKVTTKVIYNILGINQEGYKKILGFYVAESEGANFWLGVLNDLKERGVQDVLIACVDGLTGFPEAIKGVFPQTEIQFCIVHQIRNSSISILYVSRMDNCVQKQPLCIYKDLPLFPSYFLACIVPRGERPIFLCDAEKYDRVNKPDAAYQCALMAQVAVKKILSTWIMKEYKNLHGEFHPLYDFSLVLPNYNSSYYSSVWG